MPESLSFRPGGLHSAEPRVAPAMMAEGLARPTGPQALLKYWVPRMLASELDQACTVFADAFLRVVAT